MSFKSDLENLKGKLPENGFAVPIDLDASSLSEVVNHLVSSSSGNEYNFLVLDDSILLSSTIKDYLQESGKSTEIVLSLKVLPTARAPQPKSESDQPDWISCLSTGNGTVIASGCYDGFVRVYDCKSRKLMLTSSSSHKGAVKDVAMREDFVLSASKDRTAVVWKRNKSGLERFALCEGHSDSVEAIAIRPGQSNMQFVTAGWDRTVHQYTLEENEEEEEEESKRSKRQKKNSTGDSIPSGLRKLQPKNSLMGHTGSVTSAKWLDATKLCTGSYDHSLRVWDMNVGVCESTIHCGRVVTDLSCQPNGSLVCTSHPDGVARLWDSRVSNGESVVATAHFKSHKGWISSVDWTSSSQFVTAGYDGTLIIWDCRGKKPLHKIRHGDEDSKALCVLGSVPGVLISGGSDKKLKWFSSI